MADFDPMGPAMAPPPGETQDLDNPPNGNDRMIACYTVCITVASIFVALRVYAKLFFLKRPNIEDYFLLPVFALYITHCVFWLKMNGTTGNLVHMWNFRIIGLAPFYKNGFYGTTMYSSVMLAIKPLILLEWIHLFASVGANFKFRITCYILGAANVIMYLIGILLDAATCTPRAYWWDKSIPGGHCVDTRNVPIATSVINAVIDVFILLLPQGIIWKLHMNRRKRLGVALIFVVGIGSVASALARMAMGFVYSDSDDVTYNFSKAGYFMVLEMTFAILVFTAPALPKPMSHLAQQAGNSLNRLVTLRSSGSGSRGSGSARYGVHEQDISLPRMTPSVEGSDKWSTRKSARDEEYAMPPPLAHHSP